MLDDTKRSAIAEEAKRLISDAVAEMESMDMPGREVLFDYVYARGRPDSFAEGLDELAAVRRPPEVQPLRPQAPPSTGDADAPKGLK